MKNELFITKILSVCSNVHEELNFQVFGITSHILEVLVSVLGSEDSYLD